MTQFLYFGNEKESFKKLIKFIKNPVKFYESSEEGEKELLDIMTLIVRLNLIINSAFQIKNPYLLILILFFFLFARFIAAIGLWVSAYILNFLVKILSKKDDFLKAERIIAFACVVRLIPKLPILTLLSDILLIILVSVGISKQYELPLNKGFLIAIIPWIIIYSILTIIFLHFGINFTKYKFFNYF